MASPVDSSHAVAAAGAAGSVGVLTGIIVGTGHIDALTAGYWAMGVVGGAGFIWGLVIWWIKWKWPDAPPLPGDLVEVPAGPASGAVAQVLQPPPQPAPGPGEPQPPAPLQPQVVSAPVAGVGVVLPGPSSTMPSSPPPPGP